MINVDENTCIGCGACVAIDPEHFDFNDNGVSQAIAQDATENTQSAADACPVGAISIGSVEAEETIVNGADVTE